MSMCVCVNLCVCEWGKDWGGGRINPKGVSSVVMCNTLGPRSVPEGIDRINGGNFRRGII